MDVFLIRHTSVDVPKGLCYGATDVALSDSFAIEAEVVRERLQGVAFDAVFTCPLSRAVRLAAYCGYGDALVDDRVTELDFGEWEMKNFDELYKDDVRFRLWCDGDYVNTPSPGGESFAGQIKRFKSFIDEKKNQGFKRIAVFTHGGILACGLIMTGQAEAKNALSVVPLYGSVINLTV